MEDSFWLINSDRSRVKRFAKNKQNKDKFFEYMFIDSGKIVGVLGKEPPILQTIEELKIELLYQKALKNIQEKKPN